MIACELRSSWSDSAVRGGIGGESLLTEMVSRLVENAWCWLSVGVSELNLDKLSLLDGSSIVTAVLLLSVKVLSSGTGMNMSMVRGGSGGPTSK